MLGARQGIGAPGVGKDDVVARRMAFGAARCCWPCEAEFEDHNCGDGDA